MPIAIPSSAEPRGDVLTNAQEFDYVGRIDISFSLVSGDYAESEIWSVTANLTTPPEEVSREFAGRVQLTDAELKAIAGAPAFLDALKAAIMAKWPPEPEVP